MKILIADDEDYAREGLIEEIDWEELGIDEIMQAVNGAEALKIARWFQPDIVLTDIHMPRMDGIAFAGELVKQLPGSKIILISGYMEIEYLKSAIELSVIDYIEKPAEVEAVKKALRRAVEESLREKKIQEADESNLEFRQQKLFELLVRKDRDRMTVEKLAASTGFSLNGEYVCLLIQFPRHGKRGGGELRSVTELVHGMEGQVLGLWRGETSLELIVCYGERNAYRLSPLYQKLLEQWPECRLAVGIEAGDWRTIYNSYRTARAAMNCAFYQAEQRMFEIDEKIMEKRFIEPGLYGSFLRILSDSPRRISEWFQELFEDLFTRKYYQKEQVYTLMTSLLTAVYRQYPQGYDLLPEVAGEEQIQPFLLGMESLQEIREFTERLLGKLEEQGEELSGYGRVIRGVLDYVAEHYGEEDLSIARIAEQLHFSPAYLNVLFKQERKVTLKQYLNNYRLEKAKRLLDQEYLKITEIAEKCGYANANYFAKVFREAVGMTPVEYRNRKK